MTSNPESFLDEMVYTFLNSRKDLTMKRTISFSLVVLALCVAACAQRKELNCKAGDGSRAGRVIFNEAEGTASFNGIPGQDEPSSPATFTEREIKWDREVAGLTHPYFSLDRTTGDLMVTHYKQKGPDEHYKLAHCELATQIF